MYLLQDKIKEMFENLMQVEHPNIVKFHKYWLDTKDTPARVSVTSGTIHTHTHSRDTKHTHTRVRETYTQIHKHTHTHTRTRARTRARTHTHTRTHACTH